MQIMADEIRFYRANERPYGAFSNLYRRPMEFEGEVYATAEHAYQAGKARKPEVKAWLAEMLPIFPRRMHLLGQVEIAWQGDDGARVAAYFDNPMVMATPDGEVIVEIGGIYHHELVRTPDGWRSRRLLEELVWKRGL